MASHTLLPLAVLWEGRLTRYWRMGAACTLSFLGRAPEARSAAFTCEHNGGVERGAGGRRIGGQGRRHREPAHLLWQPRRARCRRCERPRRCCLRVFGLDCRCGRQSRPRERPRHGQRWGKGRCDPAAAAHLLLRWTWLQVTLCLSTVPQIAIVACWCGRCAASMRGLRRVAGGRQPHAHAHVAWRKGAHALLACPLVASPSRPSL